MLGLVFSNLLFIYLFLPLCLFLYYLTKNPAVRNGVLIVFSLIFYSFGEPVAILLMASSTLIDYFNGRFIEKNRGRKIAVLGVIISLVYNLGALCLFKYSGFLVTNFDLLTGLSIPVPKLTLPIGISFYTFQTISYVADVYRGKTKAQRNYFNYLLYVSMFFQLVAGPIVRYTDIAEQIGDRKCTAEDMFGGWVKFIIGLGKKVIIANCVGGITDSLIGNSAVPASVLAAWSGIILYTLQIYFDFSGYSDMAVGLGKMFGFSLPENFNYPYISKSASEFWRRWHISLGSFFRDYVYIPMGGNRRHQLLNVAVVWFLTGLWHGASWNYILWGLYFGVLISLEKLFFGKVLDKLPAVFSHIYMLIVIIFGWLLFYFEDMGAMGQCLRVMFGAAPAADDITVSLLKGSCFVIAAGIIFSCPVYGFVVKKAEAAADRSAAARAIFQIIGMILLLGVLTVSSLLLVKQTYNPFLYFRY